MREYSEVREILCDLLSDSIKDGKIAIGDVEIIKNMLSGIEKTYKIEMFEEDGSYSQVADMDSPSSYARGSSYANRGKHYVRGHYSRDGGYSRDGRGGYSRDGYSRARGYSRSEAKDSMMEQLGAMMEDASNDREREAIRMCMEHLNQE